MDVTPQKKNPTGIELRFKKRKKMLCVWLLALTLTISTDPANQISDVHAKSAALRRELLKDWTFAADGTFT